MSEGTNKELAC